MEADLVNMYMQRLLKEVDELTKNRLLLETRLGFTEVQNVELSKRIEDLETQLEKQSKRTKKEVDTSDF